jgi:sulfur dioxygenase
MIFRQLFDPASSTYSYLLASRHGGEALIIDPVLEKVDRYLQLVRELDLRLVKAVDTHLHADHITGLGALRDKTLCITVMGEQTKADIVSMRLSDNDKLTIEGLSLDVVYTPGHTDDSYSFVLPDRVFTGDTLLIRGTGRTDFQNGDPRAQFESIFGRLLKLPDTTLVYPAHDYKGDTVSTIGEEKAFNPRLQVRSADEYADVMNNLKLASPKMMDVAVPANMQVGLNQEEVARHGWVLTAHQALNLLGDSSVSHSAQSSSARLAISCRFMIVLSLPRKRLTPSGLTIEPGSSSGNRPKLMFIGWNERLPGSSSVTIWPPVMWPSSAPSAVVAGGSDCFALALRSGEAAGQQADAGAFDITLAAGDLAGEAQARPRLQRQRTVEQRRRVDVGVAVQAAEAGEFGILQPGIIRKIPPARRISASSGSRPCCRACRAHCPGAAGRRHRP